MTVPFPGDLAFRFPLARGEAVRQLQLALLRAGEAPGEPDGVFGPMTGEALRRFQRRSALPADGLVDAVTWARLMAQPGLARERHWAEALTPFAARLTDWHGPPVGQGRHRWRLTPRGIEVAGEDGPRRSPAAPRLAAACWDRHGAAMGEAARRFGVPVELLLATALTESGGNAAAVREEPGFTSDAQTPHRVSPGLMQTLISTAREVLGDPTLDRARLLDPATSIAAGAAMIRRQTMGGRMPTGFDPPLVAIAYNAGSLRPSRDATDPWGLVQTRRGSGAWHADSFSAFFGDALALPDAPDAATPSFRGLLQRPEEAATTMSERAIHTPAASGRGDRAPA
jgi:hypothetical protein